MSDWTAYDAPALLDAVSHARSDGRREALLRVDGLHCANCVRNVEKTLAPFADQARLSLASGVLELQWTPQRTSLSALLAAIESIGFQPHPLQERNDLRDEQRARRSLLMRIGVAALLSMQVMMLAATRYTETAPIELSLELVMRYAQWAMATPVLLYSGWPFLAGALRDLHQRQAGMDLPISIALVLAYAASVINVVLGRGAVYFDSVTMFVFLLLVARWFEGRGRAQATQRLRELASAQPLTARRETADGNGVSVEEIDSRALGAGDVLVVPPAAAVAADGRLLDEQAEFDESLLTGESRPAYKTAQMPVYAGSINVGSTPLRVRVTGTGASTLLSYVNRLIARGHGERPRVQQLADRVAGWVTLGVLVAAALGAAVWWWRGEPATAFEVALAVLVITCPCALSLATPAALAAASSALARRGLLLARADALLALARVDTVCFDKTGTLTTGGLELVRVKPLAGLDAEHCSELAAALERGIQHPVASAFAALPSSFTAREVETLPGRGVRGRIDGRLYELLGSADPAAPHDSGLTWLQLHADGEAIARFALANHLRPDARWAVDELQSLGLRTLVLSGDAQGAVDTVAQAVGIAETHAGLTPDGKLQHLAALRAAGHRVWMVGDGVNDAPTLAAADVSTALASGAALAQAQAALLLSGESLAALVDALTIARRTQRVIAENLGWAIAYNLIAIPLALAGLVTPWIAALGMGTSSVIVVLNALRLARTPSASGDLA